MKLRLVLCALLALLVLGAAAPAAIALPGDLLWPQSWSNTPGDAVSKARVAIAPTGDVYVAGRSDRAVTGIDFVVVRYTSAGVFKWRRYYAPMHTDWISDVATDRAGNVILCGRSAGSGGQYAFVTVKFSRGGVQQWARRISSAAGVCEARDVITDASGNVYVTGSVIHTATGADWCTVKYSPKGATLWRRDLSISKTKFEEGEALAFGPNGKLYVGGTAGEVGDATTDLCVVRYSAGGRFEWQRRRGVPSVNDLAWDMAVGTSGVCVVGQGTGTTITYGVLFKLTLAGGSPVLYVDGASSGDDFRYRAAGIDKYGDVIAAGSVKGVGGDYFFSVRRFHSDGSGDFTFRTGTGTGSGAAMAVAVGADGMIYVTGHVPMAATGLDILTLGLYPTWTQVFAPSWDSTTIDAGEDLALGAGCFYVAGTDGSHLILLKYAR
jgi:hypothetical protein